MALRQEIENQENFHRKMSTKIAVPAKPALTKRTALADFKQSKTNELSNLNSLNNAVAKKNGVMGPPQALAKKTVVNAAVKKDIIKKDQEKAPHPNKHDNAKPVLKRQESMLKNTTSLDDNKTLHSFKSYSSKQIAIIDPDENSKNEPQMVTEYVDDIFRYLRRLEIKYPIRKDFLEKHQSSSNMRTILVNWLVEVHLNFKLCLETLHLCVAIVDRYLQDNKNIGRDTLQLVGTTAMFIASKYEEMYTPDLHDFVYICDETFSKAQILNMEEEILKKLDFSLGRPLSVHFLRRYNKIAQVRSDQHALGKYMLELALVNYNMSHIKPSIVAAAACCLSIAVLNEMMDLPKVWTPTLVRYTTYEYSDFRNVIIDLAHLIVNTETSKHQAVRKKYASSGYAKISMNPKLHGPLIRKLTMKPLVKK